MIDNNFVKKGEFYEKSGDVCIEKLVPLLRKERKWERLSQVYARLHNIYSMLNLEVNSISTNYYYLFYYSFNIIKNINSVRRKTF